MKTLRRSEDRGHADHGWLRSFHSFSFAGYRDPRHERFGALRVINEDRVAPGMGFGTHGHRDMEIISYVLSGELAHRDSLGNGSVIRPGDVQRMSAGTGVMHSEFNPAGDAQTHFLQIWIEPDTLGLQPGYEQIRVEPAQLRGRLQPIVSADGADGTLRIHQDARILAGRFDGDETAEHRLGPGRRAYVHVARGEARVNGERLGAGDALKLEGESAVRIEDGSDAELLVFDLA